MLKSRGPTTTFNGGPDNCPAKRPRPSTEHADITQVPFNGGPDNCPAKHRRFVAGSAAVTSANAFNGGPDNCPAKRD